MSKTVLVPIADGCEEIEAVCIIDVLRRAGANVIVASVEDRLQITASRDVKLVADKLIRECMDKDYDLIVLPGGVKGAQRLSESGDLLSLLQRQIANHALYAAICASPAIVLSQNGLLGQKRATAHPDWIHLLENSDSITMRVVVDDNCITSRSPGTALEFSLKLVELLYGEETSASVGGYMLAKN